MKIKGERVDKFWKEQDSHKDQFMIYTDFMRYLNSVYESFHVSLRSRKKASRCPVKWGISPTPLVAYEISPPLEPINFNFGIGPRRTKQ